MEIKTRFGLNDKVWTLVRQEYSDWVECPACKGQGRIALADDRMHDCPACRGTRGRHENHRLVTVPDGPFTVGCVRTEIYADHHTKRKNIIQYMFDETGVGSGTLYPEDYVFATKADAQQAADAINAATERLRQEDIARARQDVKTRLHPITGKRLRRAGTKK